MSPQENVVRVGSEPRSTYANRGQNASNLHAGTSHEPLRIPIPSQFHPQETDWHPQPDEVKVTMRHNAPERHTPAFTADAAKMILDSAREGGIDLEDLREAYMTELAELQGDPEHDGAILRARTAAPEIFKLQTLLNAIAEAQADLPNSNYHKAIDDYKACLHDLEHATTPDAKQRLTTKLRSLSQTVNALQQRVAQTQVEAALQQQNIGHYREALQRRRDDLNERFEELTEDEHFVLDLTGKKLRIVQELIEQTTAQSLDTVAHTTPLQEGVITEQPPLSPEVPADYTVEIQDPEEETGDAPGVVEDKNRSNDTLVPPEERSPQASVATRDTQPAPATDPIQRRVDELITSISQAEVFIKQKTNERGKLADIFDLIASIGPAMGEKFSAWWNKDKEIDAARHRIEDLRMQEEIAKMRAYGRLAKQNLLRQGREPFAVEKQLRADAARREETRRQKEKAARKKVERNWRSLT